PASNSNSSMDIDANTIDFAGSVSVTGVDSLPTSDPTNFPASLRALTGSFLLAPGYTVSFGGGFGTVNGSIVGSKISYAGNADGTVKGSVINMKDSAVSIAGTSDIIIESQGTSNYPAGVFFRSHYAPLPHTYPEV